MKVHLTWIGVAALTAAAMNVSSASAQYAPYRPQQQPLPPVTNHPVYSTTMPTAAPSAPATAGRYAVPSAQAVAAPVAATAPQYPQTATQPVAPVATQAPATQAPATQIPAYSYPQTTYPQTAQAPSYPQTAQAPSYSISPNTTFATHGYATYPSVAQQPTPPTPPTPPAPTHGESMPAPTPPAPEHSMATPAPSAANGTASVVADGNGYASTGYQTANGYSGYGQGSCGYTDYGISGACEPEGGGHVWFGGLYWLFMERDNPNTQKLTVRVDHSTATDPYYPQANTTVIDTDATDFDFRSGVEVRFGSTFSIGSDCDAGCGNGYGYPSTCGAGCGCPPDNYAWEVAWWGLDEDNQHAWYYDQDELDSVRLYGMRNFAGIEYYDGAAWRPVNEYYGYGLPITDPGAPAPGDLIVLGQRTRSYFSCQNFEVNIIRFPVCGGGCGGGCSNGCGGGGCAAGCGNDCGYGAACGCEPACTPIAFSMCGMCGVRYFRIDDDFYYGSQFAEWGGGAYGDSSWINYDLSADNNLIGPQVGWNMNYCVGCKWNFFCNSTFGVFNNYIETNQRVWGDTGPARYAQTSNNMNSHANKNDVSFLGELRLGGSYDVTCNWRAVLAYRALAITGVANSVDQIPTDFTNAQYPGIIDSDSSIIVHGLQAGVECKY